MNNIRKRMIAALSIVALTLTGCGMDAETEKENANVPIHSTDTSTLKSETTTEQKITATTESAKTTTTADKNNIVTQESSSKDKTSASQQQSTSSDTKNDTERLTEATNDNPENDYNNKTTERSDTEMNDENDSEITYIPKSDPVVNAGNGNVSIIGTLQEQMGKEPLRVSTEESEMLISMLNEIDLEPVDSPDPASIPYGGGYIMEIDGGGRYILLGGRYLQIGDAYYYDANNKSDALSSKIGSVLYSYYG